MDEQQVFQQINNGVKLDQAKYIVAKRYLISSAMKVRTLDLRTIVNPFLMTCEAGTPAIIVYNPQWDSTTDIKKAIFSIEYKACFCEAVYSLIHAGFFIPQGNHITIETYIGYTSIRPGFRDSGSSAGWHFPQWNYDIPVRIRLSGFIQETNSVIATPDLFLKQLNIPNLNSEVKDALFDAIRCFRAELYTPCLAMLLKATEGAWTELGLSLIGSLPPINGINMKSLKRKLLVHILQWRKQ